jgi:DNA modification methylase
MDPDLVVPVLVLDLDEQEASKVLVTLDPLSALASADPEPLRELLADFQTDDESLRMLLGELGADANIDAMIGAADPNDIPEREVEERSAVGDVFALGDHRLACGDARDAELLSRLLDGDRPSVLVTDPPYGVDYRGKRKRSLRIANDDEEGIADLLSETFAVLDKVLVPGTSIYLFHPAGPTSALFVTAFLAIGWHIRQGLVWVKDALVLGHGDYHFRHEPIIYGAKPGARLGRGRARWYGGHAQTSVLEIPRPRASLDHPTAKPVALISQLVANSSRSGDVVLDPFLGSGTTLIAAEQLRRRCRAIVIDPRYADVAIARWEAFTGGQARKVESDGP